MKIKFSLKNKIPDELYKKLYQIAKIFINNNYECYFVGGFIRDILLNRLQSYEDIDIATNAKPEEVIKLFKKVIPTGIQHGTVTILYKNLKIECTTYRKESKYSNHRRPDFVIYTKNIYEDLSRRDFTINAFAYDIFKEILIDEYNGLNDLKNKLIKCIGNPKDRFLEDGLRPIRACRFLATLDFELEENTKKSILDIEVQNSIKSIAVERFTEELKKGFKAYKTSKMLKNLYDLNIIYYFIGTNSTNIKHSDFYSYLDNLKEENIKLSYWIFFENLNINVISKNLKFSNLQTKKILLYIEWMNLMVNHHPYKILTISDIKKLFNNNYILYFNKEKKNFIKEYKKHLGKLKKELETGYNEFIKNFQIFIIQKVYNIKNNKIHYSYGMIKFFSWLLYVLENEPLTIKDLDVDGNQLKQLGYIGKEIGKQLEYLLDIVLENPDLNQNSYLIEKSKIKP